MLNAPRLSPAATRLAWETGDLIYKFKPIQVKYSQAWDRAKEISRKFVLRSTRRGRKSSWLLLTGFMKCIQKKGHERALVAPVEVALEEYIQQVSAPLLADCPEDLRPQWLSAGQFYFPRTDSTIHFAGSNSKSYNKLRGYRFDDADVDEAGYIDDLKELVEGVLTPAVFDSNGYLRLSSSAPELPDHPYDEYWQKARAGGFGALFTIHDAGYPEDQVEEWVKEMGGWASAMVQREFMCRSVIDKERRIVPEWNQSYVQDVPRDEFFNFYHKYNSLDTGVRDNTVNGYAYYNFRKAALILEDETVLRNEEVRTDILAACIRQTEHELGYQSVYRRIGDNNNLIILQDLSGIHKLPFLPTSKDQLFAMVNELRLWVASGRLLINPRCTYTIGCLENGIWDKNKKEFARSATYGHFDALAMLCYLVRNIDCTTNPIPANYGLSIERHNIIPGQFQREESQSHKSLREAIKLPTGKRRTTDDWRTSAWRR